MERTIHVESNRDLQILVGKYDQNLKLIEKELNVKVVQHDLGLKVSGSRLQADKACELFDYLQGIIKSGSEIKVRDISYALKLAQPDEGVDFKRLAKEKIEVSLKGVLVTPKTKGQIEYV